MGAEGMSSTAASHQGADIRFGFLVFHFLLPKHSAEFSLTPTSHQSQREGAATHTDEPLLPPAGEHGAASTEYLIRSKLIINNHNLKQ